MVSLAWIERAKQFLANRLSTDNYVGLHLTVSFIVAALSIWVSSALLEAVLDNATVVRWDLAAAAWVHSKVNPTGTTVSKWISDIGSPTNMGVIAVVGGIELLRRRRKLLLLAWIAAFAGGGSLEKILKIAVHRTRPVFNTSGPEEQSLSFPSGHSMMCLIGVGMLVYVLIDQSHVKGVWRAVVMGLATSVVLLMGISRVYLGAHYPSDVIGGYAAGAGWIALCVGVRGIVKHRGDLRAAAKARAPATRSVASH